MLLASATGGAAQQPVSERQERPVRQFLGDIWTDQKAIWSSPFRMNKRQFTRIALPLAAGTAALIASDRDAAQLFPNTPDQVRYSRYVSNAGSAYVLVGATAAPLLIGKWAEKPGAVNVGRSGVEALADSAIVTYVLKPIFWRERPTTGAGKGRFWHGNDMSFPSGHAVMSFAVATAVARSRRTPKWLAVTAYTAATAIGLSRWSARRHSPSDIFVGAVFGGMIGNYVATRPR
jgi:membrane-associated phospholipid phosphatase